MKKKLLLLALPALMAMSSCTYLQSATVQNDFFKEEASAKVELFGDEQEALPLMAKLPNRSAESDLAEPIIGVQYRTAYTEGGKSYIALRFVAAIKSLDANAEWTRTIYEANGSVHGEQNKAYPTTQAYTALSGMGETIYPSSYGAGYNYFVAYTMYNIPVSEKDDLYIVANLKLTDTATEGDPLSPVYSKAMAARIGGGVTVKFDRNQTGYFMAGTIEGTPNSIRNKDAVTSSGDHARFTVPLAANDSFVIVNNDPGNSRFSICDYSKIEDGGESASFESDNLKIKAKIARIFILYVNSSDRIWTDIAPELFINGVKTGYSNIRTGGTDKVQCTLNNLNAGDIIRFKKGEDYLHFYYTDGSDLDGGDSYTILSNGDYTFFVTSSDKVFYSPVYYQAELSFDFSAVTSWADTFRIHAWNDQGSIGTWGESDEDIVDNKYTLFSLGKITHFIVYFRDKGTSITKESSTIDYGFAHGHSYSITVNPSNWGSDQNANRFYSGVNVVDNAA